MEVMEAYSAVIPMVDTITPQIKKGIPLTAKTNISLSKHAYS